MKVWGDGVLPALKNYTRRGFNRGITTFKDGLGGTSRVSSHYTYNVDGTVKGRYSGLRLLEGYEYTDAGRISRISIPQGADASGNPVYVTREFSYKANGQLENFTVSYNGDSITIDPELDAAGRLDTLTEPLGTWNYTYNEDNSIDLVTVPHIPGAVAASVDCDWTAAEGNLEQITLNVDGSAVHTINFGYGLDGRLSTVSTADFTATYAYKPGENLLDGVTVSDATSADILAANYTYDYKNRLVDTTTTLDPAGTPVTVAKHAFPLYSVQNQRRQAEVEAYNPSDPANPLKTWWSYAYDDTHQLAEARAYADAARTQRIPNRQYEFLHDTICNRITAGPVTADGKTMQSFGDNSDPLNPIPHANDLNQYQVMFHEGEVRVLGVADSAAIVTVTCTAPNATPAIYPTERDGERFLAMFPVDNAAADPINDAPIDLEIAVNIVQPGAGDQGKDLVAVMSGTLTIATSENNFAYTEKGEVATDNRFDYTWDVRDRLQAVSPVNPSSALQDPSSKLVFAYDYQGRRAIRKTYIYAPKSFLLLAEVIDNGAGGVTLDRTYTYGPDLSGSLDGAGGVGAPRFATKLFDNDTGLYYFGYRHYEPETGRFLCRDPLARAERP